MKPTEADVSALLSEVGTVDLGDARRDERFVEIVKAFVAAPGSSFPEMMRTAAELEGFYRFVNSDHFSFEDLARPHWRATADRIAAASGPVLVVHDATEYSFPFEEDLREGCERLGKDSQGFFGSASLALAADSLEPLGVVHATTWTKSELTFRRPNQLRTKKGVRQRPGRISADRWLEFIRGAEASVQHTRNLIHVIDREADSFALYSEAAVSNRRFVVRVSAKRAVELEEAAGELVKLAEAAARAKPVFFDNVELSRRRASKASKQHPPRAARSAKLSCAAMPITIHRGSWAAKTLPETATVNLVCVREVGAPTGEEPIEWLLATSEPIATEEQIRAVVAYYRARWTIEEFFRVLKSGCAFEKRQLESRRALLHVLAVSQIVAWHNLLLRHLARVAPDAPASRALPPVALFVLRTTGRVPLREKATVREALFAIAALGGHIKNNGYPGVITLSRGMEHLLERTAAFIDLLQALGGLQTM